jgi:hypothetical protein
MSPFETETSFPSGTASVNGPRADSVGEREQAGHVPSAPQAQRTGPEGLRVPGPRPSFLTVLLRALAAWPT